ncbi:unnamed protein product [Orchesella dallaii]|uniref:Uncharacterized protein n=1 Tax=Orchesella dallaii TaxID=48710 RepID=A0ABP1PQ79_9HEXA
MSFIYVFFVGYRLSSQMNGIESIEALEKSLGSLIQLIYVLTCYTVGMFLNIQNLLKPDITPYLISEYVKFFQTTMEYYRMNYLTKNLIPFRSQVRERGTEEEKVSKLQGVSDNTFCYWEPGLSSKLFADDEKAISSPLLYFIALSSD